MFEEYLNNKIKAKSKSFRNSKETTQMEFCQKAYDLQLKDMLTKGEEYKLSPPEHWRAKLSDFERGMNYGNNKSYLTDGLIEVISFASGCPKSEIVYGDDNDIEEFIKYIFYIIAYNIQMPNELKWNKYISFDEKLYNVHLLLRELMYFNGKFSLMYSRLEIETMEVYMMGTPFDYGDKEISIYDNTVEWVWNKFKNPIIDSFKQVFIGENGEKSSMKNINNLIFRWINKNFSKTIKTVIKEATNDVMLNIGQLIRKQTEESVQVAVEFQIKDSFNYSPDDLVNISNAYIHSAEELLEIQKNNINL